MLYILIPDFSKLQTGRCTRLHVVLPCLIDFNKLHALNILLIVGLGIQTIRFNRV